MKKTIKIACILCTVAAFSFAADTAADTAKQAASPQIVTPAPQVSSTSLPTKVLPKNPTNWSKIKDLFL